MRRSSRSSTSKEKKDSTTPVAPADSNEASLADPVSDPVQVPNTAESTKSVPTAAAYAESFVRKNNNNTKLIDKLSISFVSSLNFGSYYFLFSQFIILPACTHTYKIHIDTSFRELT